MIRVIAELGRVSTVIVGPRTTIKGRISKSASFEPVRVTLSRKLVILTLSGIYTPLKCVETNSTNDSIGTDARKEHLVKCISAFTLNVLLGKLATLTRVSVRPRSMTVIKNTIARTRNPYRHTVGMSTGSTHTPPMVSFPNLTPQTT